MYTRNFYNKNFRDISRQLRNHMTPAERKLWYEFLRYFKPRVHRQRPMGSFIVDFYIPKLRLIIEVDGGIHEDEKIKAKDAQRDKFFLSFGLRVMRFKNEEVMNDFSTTCKKIEILAEQKTHPPFGHPL